ncbi:MAG: hypothetical protein AB7O97_00390 [Planctomycetota bacterium]
MTGGQRRGAAALALLLPAAGPAQTPPVAGAGSPAVQSIAVPGTAAQAVTVLWPAEPLDGAAPGRRRAVAGAAALLRQQWADAALAQRTWPGAAPTTGLTVGDWFAVYTVVLPRADEGAAAAWFAALGGAGQGGADDRAARTLARAALAADDADWLYPGELLAGRARRALAPAPAATALLGDPAALQGMSAAELVAAAMAPPARLRVLVLGAVDGLEALRRAVGALQTASAPAGAAAAAVAGAPPEPPALRQRHPRVDAAFVAAAVAAPPPGPDALPFLIGVEVARSRAQARFGAFRGGEVLARAPFVTCRPLLGDPVAVFCRRGPDADPARPQRELEQLLASLRDEPVGPRELEAARRLLAAEWGAPPWSEAQLRALRELPQLLGARAETLCLLGYWGLADAAGRLDGIDASAVSAALRTALSAPCWWGGLVPTVEFPAGW